MAEVRRAAVLESALETFARDGYRRTSMDAVAAAAQISRQGLYFLFASKESLFREAAAHVLAHDLDLVEQVLDEAGRPLADRLVDAFDQWAGRWIGPAASDVPAVLAENPALLDRTAQVAPAVFEQLVTAAVAEAVAEPKAVVSTLMSVSIGLKQQVDGREVYRERLRIAIDLVLPDPDAETRTSTPRTSTPRASTPGR